MNEENKVLTVKQIGKAAYAGPAVCLIFTSLCLIFWADMIGIVPEGGTIMCGVYQLAVFVPYLVCAIELMKDADNGGFEGNIFLIFACLFGAVGGMHNIASVVFPFIGIPYDTSAVGYVWLLAGLLMFGVLPGCLRKICWLDTVMYAIVAVALCGEGFCTLGWLSPKWWVPFGWLYFIVALMGFYFAIGGLNGFLGVNFPFGGPILKEKEN